MKYLDEFLLIVFGTSIIDDGGLYVKSEIWIENQFEQYILVFMFVKKSIFWYMIPTVHIVNIKQTVWMCNEIR